MIVRFHVAMGSNHRAAARLADEEDGEGDGEERIRLPMPLMSAL